MNARRKKSEKKNTQQQHDRWITPWCNVNHSCVFKTRKLKETHAHIHFYRHTHICAGFFANSFVNHPKTVVFCLYLLDNIRNSLFFCCHSLHVYAAVHNRLRFAITVCAMCNAYMFWMCTNNPFHSTIFTGSVFYVPFATNTVYSSYFFEIFLIYFLCCAGLFRLSWRFIRFLSRLLYNMNVIHVSSMRKFNIFFYLN